MVPRPSHARAGPCWQGDSHRCPQRHRTIEARLLRSALWGHRRLSLAFSVCVGYGQFRTLSAQQHSILDRIREVAGSPGDRFDIFTWKADTVLFAESEWRGHNRIRKSQLRWHSAALDLGLSIDAFLVVEWSVEI